MEKEFKIINQEELEVLSKQAYESAKAKVVMDASLMGEMSVVLQYHLEWSVFQNIVQTGKMLSIKKLRSKEYGV